MLSWLSPEGVQRIDKDQGIDVSRVIPILKPNDTCWVVLAGQSDHDERTFVFDHDFEGGYENLLCGPQPLAAFLASYIQRAKYKNPLNGSNCWRSPQEE